MPVQLLGPRAASVSDEAYSADHTSDDAFHSDSSEVKDDMPERPVSSPARTSARDPLAVATIGASAAPASASFAGSACATPPTSEEAVRLGLMALVWLAGAAKFHHAWLPSETLYVLSAAAANAAALVWLRCARNSYRRWRTCVISLLQLQLPAGILAVDMPRFLCASPADSQLHQGGLLYFLGLLLAVSGVNALTMGALSYQLPPVLQTALQAAGALACAATNSRTCSSPLALHPVGQGWTLALFRVLEPAVTPLEPLLLAAGLARNHPQRHCHCVLAALQAWAAFALPVALTMRAQSARYLAWRREQRRAGRERRRAAREQRRRQAEAWGFGFEEPSSSSSSSRGSGSADVGSSTSGSTATCGSPGMALSWEESQQVREQAFLEALPASLAQRGIWQLRQRRGGRHRTDDLHLHHPADWQYAASLRAWRGVQSLQPYVARLLLAVLAPLYLWRAFA